MADIRITPASSVMSFTSSLNYIEKITQDASGSLNLYGSGSTGRTELLSIDGNNGRLFTVSDDLSDSLFSVNTIAGLPVIEAFADNSVNIGQYSAPPIRVTGSNAIITGSLLGTAATASILNVQNSTTNASYPLVFATSTTAGNKALYTDSGTECYINPSANTIGATSFVGALSGNASTATIATTVQLTSDNSNSAYKIPFANHTGTTSGNYALYQDEAATFTYNPSTNTLTAGTFSGAFSGNASTATSASYSTTSEYIRVVHQNNAAEYKVLYNTNSTGSKQLSIDPDTSHFTYNPSTHVLTAGTFSGALSGNASTATTATSASYATAAGTVAITTQDVTPVLFYLTFTGTTSGNGALNVDTSTLTYAPNTSIFSAPIVNSTTAVRGGNGSAAAPAFSFSGDTDNGMYYIGTNSVGFSTGGTARMSIDSSGNVGIGFTSSTYRLQVNDIIATVTGFGNFTALQALGGAGYRWSLNNDSTFRLHRTTNGFSSVTTPIMVDSSDRVGIGTTSMVRNFQVGSFSGSPEICIGSGTTGTGALVFGDGATSNDPWRGYVIYNHSTDTMTLGTSNAGWLTLTSGGALGLNVTPTNTAGRFEASNDIVAYSSSDKRWKTNIKNIDSPLEKISQINGVEFDWIEDEPVHGNKGHDIGVIAQEIEQVLPDAVQTRQSGMKAVKYEKVIPLLIEAIKDQQKQIEELKQLLNGFTR